MNIMLALVFLLIEKNVDTVEHDTLLYIKVVLQVNGLNHNPQIESNMFQSMFMIPILLQGHFSAPQRSTFGPPLFLMHLVINDLN